MYRLQVFCFFKQKTAYEMRISDWSSDVCSSDLLMATRQAADALGICFHVGSQAMSPQAYSDAIERVRAAIVDAAVTVDIIDVGGGFPSIYPGMEPVALENYFDAIRSEEHTSELQSLMRISYAVFCLKKKKSQPNNI